LQLLQPQLAAKRIESGFHPGGPSMMGLIDEPSMHAALMNFALNSIQAMSDGGRLSISTRKSDGKIQVEISDTGVGMTGDQAAKVFEPFFTTKSQGLGLGMSYSRKVINQHGGTVKIKSQFGDGTTVYIDLPDEWGKS
jgi:two-component system sensor histidine kinase HydH